MQSLVKIVDTKLKDAKRFIKALVSGTNNVQEVIEIAPHGIDSNPPNNKIGAYSTTNVQGVNFIYGYINNKQIAAKGESRVYSTDSSGVVKFNVWLRASGECLLGRSIDEADYVDNLVRFTPLDAAIQSDIVAFINAQLPLIATGIAAGGGSYTPATMSVDISGAKVDELKIQ